MKKMYIWIALLLVCLTAVFVQLNRVYDAYQTPPALEVYCEDFFIRVPGTAVFWSCDTIFFGEEHHGGSLLHPLERQMLTLDTLGYPAKGYPVSIALEEEGEILSVERWLASEIGNVEAQALPVQLEDGNIIPVDGGDWVYEIQVGFEQPHYNGTASYVFRITYPQ